MLLTLAAGIPWSPHDRTSVSPLRGVGLLGHGLHDRVRSRAKRSVHVSCTSRSRGRQRPHLRPDVMRKGRGVGIVEEGKERCRAYLHDDTIPP